MKRFLAAMILTVAWISPVLAQQGNAPQCVDIARRTQIGIEGIYLTNTCDQPIELSACFGPSGQCTDHSFMKYVRKGETLYAIDGPIGIWRACFLGTDCGTFSAGPRPNEFQRSTAAEDARKRGINIGATSSWGAIPASPGTTTSAPGSPELAKPQQTEGCTLPLVMGCLREEETNLRFGSGGMTVRITNVCSRPLRVSVPFPDGKGGTYYHISNGGVVPPGQPRNYQSGKRYIACERSQAPSWNGRNCCP